MQKLATANGTSFWSQDHGALSKPSSTLDESLPHSHAELPWALEKSEVPDGAEPSDEVSVANVDTAIAVGEREGLRHPMTVALPAGDQGTFSAIGYAFDQPSDERTVHVDRYGGKVRATYGYDDYPLLAKVVSQGIGLHEGRSLGLANMVGSAAVLPGGDRAVRDRAADVVATPAQRDVGWGLREGGCRSRDTRSRGRSGRSGGVPPDVRDQPARRTPAGPVRAAQGARARRSSSTSH